jgi:hypothetical protein
MEKITTIQPAPRFALTPKTALVSFGASTLAAIATLALLVNFAYVPTKPTTDKYTIFTAKPLVLGKTSERVLSADARAAALDGVLEYFDCPMQGMGKAFVKEADKNGIPYWLVPAISFQESSCGKKTPEPNGIESYNGWGWGVWGDNISMFSDWEHGIETVSKYMKDRFYSKGISDPCEIMRVYTPPSNGSWCEGVNYFKDVITQYESKDY